AVFFLPCHTNSLLLPLKYPFCRLFFLLCHTIPLLLPFWYDFGAALLENIIKRKIVKEKFKKEPRNLGPWFLGYLLLT
ncbi:MAG: hypothetical protein IKX95_02420, partial [Lachnospiraceae bacterium]|nr:hypothetical protein [Lachnospiraceae bacterium]